MSKIHMFVDIIKVFTV